MKVIASIIILFLLTNCATQENCSTLGCEPPQKIKRKSKKSFFKETKLKKQRKKEQFFVSKTRKKKKKKKLQLDLFEKKTLPKRK